MADQVTVKLPDGSTRQYPPGVTPAEVEVEDLDDLEIDAEEIGVDEDEA